ncbi:MAG TPA: Phenylacetic acid catabolic protein [Ktedonobacterales bacterium]|jgi:phenylacetate-CoA oxygenase PaaI subunit
MTGATETADRALFDLLARLADNKYFLGRRYAEWCSAAPTLESGVAAAAMAQDELGHARAIYPLLRDLAPAGIDPQQIDPDTRTAFSNLRALDQMFGSWPDFVAANFLVDTALSVIFQAAVASSFEPLAARSRKVLQEERVHALHGEAWVRRLARGAAPMRAAILTALRGMWDETLCWFGPPDVSDALVEQGVLDAAPDVLQERFLGIVGPVLVAAGLDLPLRRVADGGWEPTAPLPWAHWNAARYRLNGPDAPEPAPSAEPATARRGPKPRTAEG